MAEAAMVRGKVAEEAAAMGTLVGKTEQHRCTILGKR